MPQVDVLQEMFVAAAPVLVVRRLCRPGTRRELWPDLRVTLSEDRGVAGQRYLVSGDWRGSAELWLPACADGVLVHSYLRLDPPDTVTLSARRCRREQRRRAAWLRRALWRLKDELESDRAVGEPAVPVRPDPTAAR
ncbi:MAG: hypothetical protein WCA46_24435 [Actinocatenispora sp.]